jgi:hypothetical protein
MPAERKWCRPESIGSIDPSPRECVEGLGEMQPSNVIDWTVAADGLQDQLESVEVSAMVIDNGHDVFEHVPCFFGQHPRNAGGKVRQEKIVTNPEILRWAVETSTRDTVLRL